MRSIRHSEPVQNSNIRFRPEIVSGIPERPLNLQAFPSVIIGRQEHVPGALASVDVGTNSTEWRISGTRSGS